VSVPVAIVNTEQACNKRRAARCSFSNEPGREGRERQCPPTVLGFLSSLRLPSHLHRPRRPPPPAPVPNHFYCGGWRSRAAKMTVVAELLTATILEVMSLPPAGPGYPSLGFGGKGLPPPPHPNTHTQSSLIHQLTPPRNLTNSSTHSPVIISYFSPPPDPLSNRAIGSHPGRRLVPQTSAPAASGSRPARLGSAV
jgi:hypothetical protein